jgi:hypothetical protein
MKIPASFVEELRHILLDLHKALLDAQRIGYEREHGRIGTSNEFLGLVLEHPTFAWLRTLSALIARLDEWLDLEDEAPEEDLKNMIDTLRSLVEVNGQHPTFSTPYWEFVNDVPEVLVWHVKLSRLLQGM